MAQLPPVPPPLTYTCNSITVYTLGLMSVSFGRLTYTKYGRLAATPHLIISFFHCLVHFCPCIAILAGATSSFFCDNFTLFPKNQPPEPSIVLLFSELASKRISKKLWYEFMFLAAHWGSIQFFLPPIKIPPRIHISRRGLTFKLLIKNHRICCHLKKCFENWQKLKYLRNQGN